MKITVPSTISTAALAISLCAPASLSAASPSDSGFKPPRKPAPAAYSRLWVNSPFTEKVVIQQEQGPGFADKLRLEGVMTMDGKDVACLTNTETDEVLYVRKDKPVEGISLVSIQNRGQIDQTRVILAAGGQRSTISFDDAQIVVTPAAGAKKQQTDGTPNEAPQGRDQKAQPGGEKTKLSEQEMLERRRKFWESMRDRRRRGGGDGK